LTTSSERLRDEAEHSPSTLPYRFKDALQVKIPPENWGRAGEKARETPPSLFTKDAKQLKSVAHLSRPKQRKVTELTAFSHPKNRFTKPV
jgi:hypothetical protein